MQIFKFGGASIHNVENIQNVASIVKEHANMPLVLVISAMGKTTNALEKVAEAYYAGDKDAALQLFDAVKKQHITLAKYLLVKQFNDCLTQLTDLFTEVEWMLHDKPVRHFDYYYDQVVCIGELLSTCIISHYFSEENIHNNWLDVRDVLRTDNNFRDALVDWDYSTARIKETVADLHQQHNIIITQGFIGSTSENESTSLGREGSDYSAAIFANVLDATSLTIWKDVEGVMNADPKQFPNAQLLQQLSYNEVIEMAYYGAQVIHPKTIKPLQNKNIALYVKCFLDTSLPGTVITNQYVKNLPPIMVAKNNQTLITLRTQDFSFVSDQPIIRLYEWMEQLKIKPNLIQTGAITVDICIDDHAEKIAQLAILSAALFDMQVTKELSLLTIRHYNSDIINQMLEGKNKILVQQTKETFQVVSN